MFCLTIAFFYYLLLLSCYGYNNSLPLKGEYSHGHCLFLLLFMLSCYGYDNILPLKGEYSHGYDAKYYYVLLVCMNFHWCSCLKFSLRFLNITNKNTSW